MDSEKHARPVLIHKYPNIEYRCSPLIRNRSFANKMNPFDTVGNYHEKRLIDKLQKKYNGEITNIYDQTVTSPLSTSIASDNVQSAQEVRQELIEDLYSNYSRKRESVAPVYKRSDKTISQPTFSLPAKRSENSQASVCSRNLPKCSSYRQVKCNNYEQINNHEYLTRSYSNKPSVLEENIFSEKNSNAHTLHDMCNEEFVLKTMQRHARLQKIVKKLVVERQKEKQREAWNNYINELKNKHRYYSNEPTRIVPQYVPNEDECIDDFWGTGYSRQQPDQYQNVLKNLSRGHRTEQPNKCTVPCPRPRQYYERNPCCYPTASQGRLMMLNKERERINPITRPLNKYKTIQVDRDLNRRRYDNNKIKCNRTFPEIQTDTKYLNTQGIVTENINNELNRIDCSKRIFEKQISKMATLKEQMLQTDKLMETPLQNIEQKLDSLIKSVNSVIVEIRGQKNINMVKCPITKSRSISCTLRNLSDLVLNRTKSESHGYQKDNEVLYTTVVHNNTNQIVLSEIGTSTPQFREPNENAIEKIIEEEMEKSKKIKEDIEELLHTKCSRQCSVEIEFDIPTRETSTLAADSLPKATCCTEQGARIHSLIRSEHGGNSRLMTIAVNTDPLGLCALLQVSAETIKQLLSYMLNLNYDSYLPVLQLRRRPCVSHYICNICGETFCSPSQLSDHIENHYFGRRRNCCVCRHVLNSKSDRIGLFTCKYCGQRFTRAYCCELHQQSCAKRFGKDHDVQLNLLLLR